MGTTPRSGLEGSSARPKQPCRATEPHLTRPIRQLKERRSLPRVRPRQTQRTLRRAARLLCREPLGFSVALDRDRAAAAVDLDPVDPWALGPALAVPGSAAADPGLADPGHTGRRALMALVPKKACARVPARTQHVRPWDHDHRARRWQKDKPGPKGTVRNSTADRALTVDRDLIVGPDLIVDRDLKALLVETADRDPKALLVETADRDPKALLVETADRDPIVDRDSIVDLGPIVDRDSIVDLGPMADGRRKPEGRTLVDLFRKPNPRHRNKPRSRSYPQSR
jgi:hypothetical protein